ncbi:MAG: elongation factor Ts [Patescibacteria group bacterium]
MHLKIINNMSMELIKTIREETSLSLKDIKKAIDETGSDDKEIVIKHLREHGVLKAAARADRATSNGAVFSYVHEGRIGVMVSLKCETDFVARAETFKNFGNQLCLHVAAYMPKFVSPEEVDQAFIDSELEIAKKQLEQEGKPADKINMILEGKKSKITGEVSLLKQAFIMDPSQTVEQYLLSVVQQTGENIKIDKFLTLTLN